MFQIATIKGYNSGWKVFKYIADLLFNLQKIKANNFNERTVKKNLKFKSQIALIFSAAASMEFYVTKKKKEKSLKDLQVIMNISHVWAMF